MIPKTERELVIYFKLVELERLYKKLEENYGYMNEHFRKLNMDRYIEAKNKYLKLVQDDN